MTVSGQEAVFCWVSVPYLTIVVGLVVFFNLLTNGLSEPTPTNAPVVDEVVSTIWDELKSFNLNQTKPWDEFKIFFFFANPTFSWISKPPQPHPLPPPLPPFFCPLLSSSPPSLLFLLLLFHCSYSDFFII